MTNGHWASVAALFKKCFKLFIILSILVQNNHLFVHSLSFDVSNKANHSYLDITIYSAGQSALSGQIGLGLAQILSGPTETCDPGSADQCFEWGDFAQLYLTQPNSSNFNCGTIEWRSSFARRLEDCFWLESTVFWYGGGGPSYRDYWPKNLASHLEAPMAPGDGWTDSQYGGVSENYWVISSGIVIHAPEEQPLFFSMNSTRDSRACLVAEDKWPYSYTTPREGLRLKYDICVGADGENFKDVHQRGIKKYYDLPTDVPDLGMMLKPFWCTWAEFKFSVNQSVVERMAEELIFHGFEDSSHIEVDGIVWESCYGQYEFDTVKFPDPAGMTDKLRQLGFRTTLWTQPLINIDCPAYKVALKNGYFVKDFKGVSALTSWWQGKHSGHIDFTNPAAVEWWTNRLRSLQTLYGFDSFKFDAGEYNWLPQNIKLTGHPVNSPAISTTKYVEAAAQFGGLIEVRAARRNQKLPIFIRMLDKDSRWGYDNGLQSIIPTLLDFGIKGYPFVIPDMVGGNSYGEEGWNGPRPPKELFIRWMQATSFMPAVQLSTFPWHYDQQTMDNVKRILNLRTEFRDNILLAALQAVMDGSPMNRPMWWVDPLDPNTFAIDDQYMLGDDILVAPVLRENATSRDIYLPKGRWTMRMDKMGNNMTYEGPLLLSQFFAPIDILPFFIKEPQSNTVTKCQFEPLQSPKQSLPCRHLRTNKTGGLRVPSTFMNFVQQRDN